MKGVVYVLTNVGMHLAENTPLVKIGRTTDLKSRLRSLYHHAGIPYPFTVHCAVEVEDAEGVEKMMHDVFAKFRVDCASSRRIPPEFFKMEPERAAAKLRLFIGDAREVDDNHAVASGGVSEGNASPIPQAAIDARDALEQARRHRPFKFSDWGIPMGSVLRFARDPTKTATVMSDVEVELDGERMRLGKAANKLLPFSVRVAGAGYWEYEDPEHGWELLSERRERIVKEREENDAESEE